MSTPLQQRIDKTQAEIDTLRKNIKELTREAANLRRKAERKIRPTTW
jgi:molecular chaperone GrpE (heat shock protein)